MKAKSFRVESIDEIEEALAGELSDGYAPTLAFVFMTEGPDFKMALAPFEARDIAVFGATSNGEFIDGELSSGAIAVLLLDLPQSAFYMDTHELSEGAEFGISAQAAQQAKERFTNPVFFLTASHVETNAEALLRGIESIIGVDANVFGATAGMNMENHSSSVASCGRVMDRGMIILVMDGDKVAVDGIATCGWRAVGSIKTITKSDGMWVHEIDGEPALDLILKYGGITDSETLTPEMWFSEFATSLPMQLLREEGATVMRPSLVYDVESRSVMCNGSVPEGSQVRFSLPPEDDVIDRVIEGCQTLQERSPEADAIVYFSCAGRMFSLGPLMKREIDSVQELWDVPLAGFFSTGEMARATGGRLELNNITSCCVVLKEN